MQKTYNNDKKLDLFEQWTALDDKELQKNPISIRLPLHVLARLAALTEVFPKQTRSELIVGLIKAGLETLERESFPLEESALEKASGGTSVPFLMGVMYRTASNKHYKKLAKEIGVTSQEIFPLKEKK